MITPVEVLGKELRRGFGYKARMKQFINGQMDILDNPVYEMEFEIAGCEQTDGDEEDEQQKQFGNEQ